MAMGDAASDLKMLLATLPGGQSLDQRLVDFQNYIKAQAEEGARAGAVSAIQPYLMALFAIAGGALLLSTSTWLTVRRAGIKR
jgi:hypothetical protein